MSDDKQRIDELEKKLLDLHEKYEEAKDAKVAAEKAQAAAEASNRFNWFSKEMLAVYMAMLGGIGAWGENLMNRLSFSEHIEQQQVKEQKVENKVGEGLVQYVDLRVGDVTDTCQLYLDAVMQAMPSYQRTKVEKFISDNENQDVAAASAPVGHGGGSRRSGSGSGSMAPKPPSVPEPAPDPVDADMDEVADAPAPPEQSTYQMILQQAQHGDEIDLENVLKKSHRKVQLKDTP